MTNYQIIGSLKQQKSIISKCGSPEAEITVTGPKIKMLAEPYYLQNI